MNHIQQPAVLTMATVEAVLDQLFDKGVLFHLDDEGLTRHLAASFFGRNVWHLPLEEIRELIFNLDGCPPNIPSDMQKFPEWVRKELFLFEWLPRKSLAELYDWASKDLRDIENNIANCNRAIHELEHRESKADADDYEVRFHKYFLELNKTAKDEIVDVLAHSIHEKALRNSYWADRIYKALVNFAVWTFHLNPPMFDPAAFSTIRHNFRDLAIPEWREMERLYKEPDKTEFDQRLETYISEIRPADQIRCLIDEHHLLAARKTILQQMLGAYERKEFALFMNAAATQVEGIIEDCCLLSGLSLDKLRKSGSISSKVYELVNDPSVRIDNVYYAFKFPVVRNRVAHGQTVPTEMRDTHLLLLDLYDCCRMVCEHPGTTNALVKLLRRATPGKATIADVVEFATIYAETNGESPNQFYGLDEEFTEFTLLLDDQVLWSFMQALLNGRQFDEIDNGLRLIGRKLKKIIHTRSTSCVRLLAGLGERGKGKFRCDRFMTAVRSWQGHDHLVKNLDELRRLFVRLLQAREKWLRTSEIAYARWEERGRTHGRDWEDWFAAEKKLGVGNKR